MDQPGNFDPVILFEDPNLLVIEKPAGLLSQADGSGAADLVSWLQRYLGRPYVGLVHRLDRNTTGLMVVAKRTKSAQRLSVALQAGKIFRRYRAWLTGDVREPRTWKHFLKKDEHSNRVTVHRHPVPGTKEAILHLTPLTPSTWDGLPITLVQIQLETGRSHQIRAQCSAEGFPLVGDVKYATSKSFKKQPISRPALHSAEIDFPHPIGGKSLHFTSELPEDMKRLGHPR